MTDPAAPTTPCSDFMGRYYCSLPKGHEGRHNHNRRADWELASAEALDVPTFAVEVRNELTRARSKFGPIASLHEGYAVILEELDEFWEDVRSNDPGRLIRAYRELVQVAAMAQRTAEDAIARLRSQESDR